MSVPNTPSAAGFQIPDYILDDLCSRFIINIPEEERQNLIRVFFQIELAHWFYLDFYCQETPSLKACGIKDFSAQVFKHCPSLIEHASSVDKHLESWKGYKMAVPTYGAILIDPTMKYCLLVQGYWSKANWGFPKGKVNEDETEADCAIREVLEETGFDISHLLDKEEYLEFKLHEQLSRLYIIAGVSMDTKFLPQTRNEIKKLQWFALEYLPAHKKDLTCKTYLDLPPNAFFMVIPFVKPLRRWVSKRADRSSQDTVSSQKKYQARSKDLTTTTYTMSPQTEDYLSSSLGTDKFKQLKPVRLFSGSLNENQDGQTLSGKTSPGRTQRLSPSRIIKQKNTSTSPRQSKKQMAKQRRDTVPEQNGSSSKKNQGPLLSGPIEIFGRKTNHNSTDLMPINKSKSWMNFKLDVDAILACL